MADESTTVVPDAKELVDSAFSLIQQYSASVSSFPSDDYEYHCAFRGFSRHVATHTEAMLGLMDACVRQVPKKRRATLSSKSMTSEQMHSNVMETIDSLLENVDNLLDESRGQRLHGQEQLQVSFGSGGQSFGSYDGSSSRVIVKPQLAFESPVDNSHTPFQAVVFGADGSKSLAPAGVHPYQQCIESFRWNDWQLLPCEDIPYLPLDATPLTFIDTPELLADMIAKLKNVKELAVDLEHHDFHSYQGITCLMQISTRFEDFIIDTLKLRAHCHRLNEVFLNPVILKVFHGAKEDVRWLQKDLNVFVANMFDTGIALQNLHMPHGLAFAVDHFCQVRLDKKYQTADWRVRPIPAEMVKYARQDTHYLLYVYDRLKAMLLQFEGRAAIGNLLVHVLQESRRLCLTLYEKPAIDPEQTYKEAMGRSLGGLTAMQMEILRLAFNWRDDAAREADESPPAVMHTAAILQIASKLPTTAKEVLKCCVPVSVVVRRDVLKLVELLRQTYVAFGVDADNMSSALTGVLPVNALAATRGPGAAPAHSHFGFLTSHVHHQPMTGTLPSVLYRSYGAEALDDKSHLLNAELVSDISVCYEESRWGPSKWFQAMQQQAAALKSLPKVSIQLPGHATTMRLTLVPKPIPQEAPKAKVVQDEEAAPQELLGDCVKLHDDVDDELAVAEGVDETLGNDDEGAQGTAATASVAEWKPKEAVAVKEAFGTGRKGRLRRKRERDALSSESEAET